MGIIKKGILGGFSGKVGTVVGSTWNSICYMRSMADSYADANTEKQRCQRKRFAAAMDFLKTVTPYLRIGYRNCGAGQSTFSAAMSEVLKNAVEGCEAGATVNFQKALLSKGPLTKAADADVTVGGGKATFSWTDNSGVGSAKADDVAMVLAYDKDNGEAVYDTQAGTRADGTAELTLPTAWAEDALAVYLSFCSADGREVSNSTCLQDEASTQQPGGGTGTGGGSGETPLG